RVETGPGIHRPKGRCAPHESARARCCPDGGRRRRNSYRRLIVADQDTYSRLIELLDQNQAHYRLIDHAPEGRTDIVSPMRGNDVKQAAKCIILMVKQGKKVTKYVLGVVPGDARIDMKAVGALLNATYVSFASTNIAEELAGSVAGTILPF